MGKLSELKEGELKWLRHFQLLAKVSLAVTQRTSECSASYLAHLNGLPDKTFQHSPDDFFPFILLVLFFCPLCSLWKTSSCCCCTSGIIKNPHQVHLVRPLEVVLHRPIIETNPGVVMAQAWKKRKKKENPHIKCHLYVSLKCFLTWVYSKTTLTHKQRLD